MEILYYDCFSGISGDMNLSAMIDLGVPSQHLIDELKKLNVEGYHIRINKEVKMGISGTKASVDIDLQEHGHGHGHGHGHNHTHAHEHEHRTFKEIRALINLSSLAEEVKKTSIDIFEKVAVAEAKIHNKSVDNVHFHEVGAVDSIVDIVGAAICFHYLKPQKVLCSTIELGGGFVHCAHGKFPVPAPATIEILKNIPVKLGTVKSETTTPTGAAILATLVDEFTDSPGFKVSTTAYGIGHKDFDIPNVLRVHSGSQAKLSKNKAQIIECNIDDMPAEHFGYIVDLLLDAGAQDVYLTPIIMKKTRPATKISVLCDASSEQHLSDILLKESTTLGLRCFPVEKTILDRRVETIHSDYGNIDVKIALYNGSSLKFKPEYEQCRLAAKKHHVPIMQIMEEVITKAKKNINE